MKFIISTVEMNPGFEPLIQFQDIYVFDAVCSALIEMQNQDTEWGENRIQNGLLWQAILSEEVGEVAQEVLHQDLDLMRAELVQVAAVALNWIKAIDRKEVPSWYQKHSPTE